MAVSTDFLQTWSGTCWWTGLLLNTKYQTRSQFGFCPTRNTNQPLFILRHILATAKKKRMKVFTAFMDLLAAYDSIPREKLWRHLQKNKTPQYLRDIIQMYDIHICTQEASTFLLMATKLPRRLRPTKAWSRAALWVPFCIPFIPMTLTDSWPCREVLPLPWIQVPHCDDADDIALTSNTAERLQFQLNKFHNYTRFKGFKLNTDKLKVLVFFSKDTAIPTFTYDGTPASRTCHSFQIPWIHSHSWWKHAHSSWENGRQLEARHS